MTQTIALGELFTEQELTLARDLFEQYQYTELTDALEEQVIKPAMPRINERTGQENSSRYFAYVLEAAIASVTP